MKSHVFPCAQCAAHGQNTTARLRQETCHQVWEAWTISLLECGIHSALKITIIRLESFIHVFQLFVLISAISTSSETITWQTTESHCASPQNLVSSDFCITHYSMPLDCPATTVFMSHCEKPQNPPPLDWYCSPYPLPFSSVILVCHAVTLTSSIFSVKLCLVTTAPQQHYFADLHC